MTAACVVCHRRLEPTRLQCCLECLADVRRSLAAVERLYGLLPSMLGRPDAASLGAVMGGRSDEARLPGGDALAMLGPGAAGGEGEASDPPAVAFELWAWCEDWAGVRGETGRLPCTVPGEVAWLTARLSWGAEHHPAWDELVSDVRRIVARLEAGTGSSDAPERGVSCPYCGTALVRYATSRGYPDDWDCQRCRRAFNPGQYNLALRTAREGA